MGGWLELCGEAAPWDPGRKLWLPNVPPSGAYLVFPSKGGGGGGAGCFKLP